MLSEPTQGQMLASRILLLSVSLVFLLAVGLATRADSLFSPLALLFLAIGLVSLAGAVVLPSRIAYRLANWLSWL